MNYKFNIKGHRNITGAHKTTLEFTKDLSLTKKGDCIIGTGSDFKLQHLKKFLDSDKISITINVKGLKDTIKAMPNKAFSSDHEMVIRMGTFDSERTFALRADKGSKDIDRRIIKMLAEGSPGEVVISSI